jgi:hypothetical protein
MSRRVLLIGFEGAASEFYESWADAGLPCFPASALRYGAGGVLKSTLPLIHKRLGSAFCSADRSLPVKSLERNPCVGYEYST